MFTPTKILLFVLFLATNACAQVVQISAATAEPAKLDCSQQTTSRVTAQIAFWGFDPQNLPVTISVRLSTYSAKPVGNNVDIPIPGKDVELRQSPGITEFEVVCSAATRVGEVKFAATIVSVPSGIKVELPVNELGIAKLTIVKK